MELIDRFATSIFEWISDRTEAEIVFMIFVFFAVFTCSLFF